jgi:LPS sulfotransferase NodH
MSGYVTAKFDLASGSAVKKILVIASSYRSGSTQLSTLLWRDGRFGAPFEYFNFEKHMHYMMARFNTTDFDEYTERLFQVRTSRNGIFSVKAHAHHFSEMLTKSRVLARAVGSAQFIYINRQDKIAQAVSMAKALQTNAWNSFERPRNVPLFYSFDFIQACLDETMAQTKAWWRWFNDNGVQPHVINHEEFTQDGPAHVARLAKWVGAEDVAASAVTPLLTARQADSINEEWISRYKGERAVRNKR